MLRLAVMKVWLVFLVILVSNQVSTQGSESLGTKDRQSKQLNEPEQKYDLELSFPITSDEAINAEGRVERIDELIQAILNNEELVSFDDEYGIMSNISKWISQYYVHFISRRT